MKPARARAAVVAALVATGAALLASHSRRPAARTPLARGIGLACGMVADDRFVYLAIQEPADGLRASIVRLPVLGGAPVTLAVIARPLEMRHDRAHLYLRTHEGSVVRLAKSGGALERLPALATDRAESLAVDDEHVYLGGRTSLWRWSKHGGELRRLVRDPPDPLARSWADHEPLAWRTEREAAALRDLVLAPGTFPAADPWPPQLQKHDPVTSIASGPTHLYFATQSGRLIELPKSGGLSKVIAQGPPGAMSELAHDGDSVYWLQSDPEWPASGSELRGATPRTYERRILARAPRARGLVVSRDSVLFIADSGGSAAKLARVSKIGGHTKVTLHEASGSCGLGQVAADATYIFWTSACPPGALFTLPRHATLR